MTEEVPLTGGFVNPVVRVGATVRRPCGPWTAAVHALLRHLESRGFPEAPRILGTDERGREVLSFIDGTAFGWTDWPPVMLRGDGLAQLGALLRRYHEVVRGFVPPPGAVWRNPLAPRDGELIRHGDFAPYNTIWRGDRVVGVIDWDFAQPGPAVTDLAYLAWYTVPLSGDRRTREYGFPGPVDRAERLRTLCAAYGQTHPAAVVNAAIDWIETERRQTLELARRGVEPWVRFAVDGNPEAFAAEAAWIRTHRDDLLG